MVGEFFTAQIIYTSIYMICIVVSIVPYLIILKIISQGRRQFAGSAYKIMFTLGIADIIQLVFHSFAFISTVADSTFSYTINKICGSILNAGWFTFISCTLLLAINRFVMLCLPRNLARWFDIYLLKILLIFVWLPGLAFLIISLTPKCSIIYYIPDVCWDYIKEDKNDTNFLQADWCEAIDQADFLFSMIHCGLATILYFLIFAKLLLVRKKYSSTDRKYRGELKLLFQASIIGGYTVFSEVAWHFAGDFIEDELLANFLGNIMWIWESGLTPIVYLMINNSIRNAFLEFLGVKKPQLTVTTVVNPMVATTATVLFTRRKTLSLTSTNLHFHK